PPHGRRPTPRGPRGRRQSVSVHRTAARRSRRRLPAPPATAGALPRGRGGPDDGGLRATNAALLGARPRSTRRRQPRSGRRRLQLLPAGSHDDLPRPLDESPGNVPHPLERALAPPAPGAAAVPRATPL